MIHKLKYLRTSLLLVFVLFGVSKTVSAQYMEFEWSDEYRFTNRKTGFFSEYLGAGYTSIYLLQRNISKSKSYDNAKLKIVALNKNSLVEDTVLALKGFPENEGDTELDDLDYLTSIVTEDGIFVFWRKYEYTDSTREEQVYAQSFRSTLKPALSLRKVYGFTYDVEFDASIFDSTRSVIAANPGLDRIVVGTETYEDGEVAFKYVTLDSKLNASSEKSFPLPQTFKKFPKELTSEYEVRDNGMLYAKSVVKYTVEELFGKGIDHPRTYHALTVADISSGKHFLLNIRGENKTITDYSYQDVGGKTRVLGFYGDLDKDTTGIDDQGVFYADIDNENVSSEGLKYLYFERSIKNRIMSKKDRRKREGDLTAEEILNTRFDIEHIETMEDSSLIVFFTMEYNTEEKTSRSDLNGRNVYSMKYGFKKSNVLALRLADNGEVLWARKIERKASYKGEDADDIQVVYQYGKFVVMFGNENPKLKSHRKKRLRHLKKEIEYATFDPNSGRAKIYEVEINEPRTMLKDLRYIDPRTAVAVDGKFYFHQIHVRQNPIWTAANVLFVPTLYYTILTGNTKLGKGDFTVMKVMPGKKPKRKR